MNTLPHIVPGPTKAQPAPIVDLVVEGEAAWIELQLDPSALLPALLNALGGAVRRTHVAAYRTADTPEARVRALAELANDPAVMAACCVPITILDAQRMRDSIEDQVYDLRPCGRDGCERLSRWATELCDLHEAARP